MEQEISLLKRNIVTNPHEGISHSIKARSPKSAKSPLPLEQLYTQNIPFWKRISDIIGAVIGFLIFSPLILAVAIAIKLTSKGPIFFVQERTGQNLSRFKMYKFRTMIEEADQQLDRIQVLNEMSGPLIKMKKDPRVTPIGRFLRKTSFDELPQLFNILKGDMTIIGPRALSPLPSQYENWQLRRFFVKPGLICTWQAERRGEMDFTEWMRSDLKYMDRSSFWMDIRVLVKTVLRVISLKGAH